jgi:hypothetical protein
MEHVADLLPDHVVRGKDLVREALYVELTSDQTPAFDPAEPEPVPEDDFDQSWGA